MRRILIAVACGLATGTLVCAGALAQQLEGVDVEASRIVKERLGTSSVNAPIEAISLNYRVSYSDLDLSTHDGAVALKDRVNEAAKAACRQISQLYPSATPDDASCTKQAVDSAMPSVKKAIAAAKKTP